MEMRRLMREKTDLDSHHRQGEHEPATTDVSFHNNTKVVKEWIRHLKVDEDDDGNIHRLLDLVSKMLLTAKESGLFVWQVQIDLYKISHPSATPQKLKVVLREIAQPSETSLNGNSTDNNPLQRAIDMRKPWQEEVLRGRDWSVETPGQTA
jgi:hypothetical protein